MDEKRERRPISRRGAARSGFWPAPKAGQINGLDFGRGVRLGVFLEEVESGGLFGSELGGFRDVLDGSRGRHFRQQLNAAVVLKARASGDKAAHDDVFLEAAEIVHLARDSRFGEDASGLLEARGRDEGIGRNQRRADSEYE